MNSQPPKKGKVDLFDLVTSALQAGGWNILYTEPLRGNPMHIIAQRDDVSCPLRVYIWNLTHGGGAHRPKTEYRIQVTGVASIDVTPGMITLLLGWWEPASVFAGFDALKHAGRQSRSPSIQIGEEALSQATVRGLVPYNKGNGEIAYAIRPDMLAAYMQDLAILHEIGAQPNEVEAIESPVGETPDDTNVLESVAEPRREVVRSIRAKIRNAQFRQRVLTAYSYSCAMCLIQMELVEAAHIVPVAYPGSRDIVPNGIALCALHHKAFDRGIVTPHIMDGAYRLALNLRELERFQEMGIAEGYDRFKSQLAARMKLPTLAQQHPAAEYIMLGNQLRGWNEDDFENPNLVEYAT